jgi:hypothetical protein
MTSFAEYTINGNICLGMSNNFAFSRLEEAEVVIFQQLGALPHYSSTLYDTPKCRFPEISVDRGSLVLAL